jgi:hypothetical protein
VVIPDPARAWLRQLTRQVHQRATWEVVIRLVALAVVAPGLTNEQLQHQLAALCARLPDNQGKGTNP